MFIYSRVQSNYCFYSNVPKILKLKIATFSHLTVCGKIKRASVMYNVEDHFCSILQVRLILTYHGFSINLYQVDMHRYRFKWSIIFLALLLIACCFIVELHLHKATVQHSLH